LGEGEESGEVVKFDVGRDEANSQLLQALYADLVDEDVDEGRRLARCGLVQLEEAAIVALYQGVSGLQGVRHWFCFLLLWCQCLEHAESFRLQFTKKRSTRIDNLKIQSDFLYNQAGKDI